MQNESQHSHQCDELPIMGKKPVEKVENYKLGYSLTASIAKIPDKYIICCYHESDLNFLSCLTIIYS